MLKYLLSIPIVAAIGWGIVVSEEGVHHAIAASQVFCPTRPHGDNTNACASTAFVQANAGGGSSGITVGTTTVTGATNGNVLTDNSGVVGQVAPSTTVNSQTCALGGSCTITATATSVTAGTTTVAGPCTTGYNLYDNGGTLGCQANGGGATGIPNLSGSAQNTTGTISGSSPALALAAAKDFVNGQGIRVNHAGPAFTLNAPTAASVTPQGTAGSTTYSYKIASIDAAGGVGAAIAAFQTTTGNATLSAVNYNQLNWTAATGTAPAGYAIYKSISSVYTLIGVVGSQNVEFFDNGYTAYPFTDWVPSTAPASSVADALITTVSSGGGTTSLTLGASATTAATSQGVFHDDSSAIQTYLNANTLMNFPSGTFYVGTALNIPVGETVNGVYGGSKIQSVFLNENLFTPLGDAEPLSVSGAHISNLSFYLVPGATAINGVTVSNLWIDHLWCAGGGVGGFSETFCISFATVDFSGVQNIYMNQWVGTIGFGTGGSIPAIQVNPGISVGGLGDIFSNIIAINEGFQVLTYPILTLNDCLNCNVVNSYLNANWNGISGVLGLTGIEIEGDAEAIYINAVQTLNFQTNIRTDTASAHAPVTVNITNSHFDFCSQYCVLIMNGNQIGITNSTFEGEDNTPWNLTSNVGIHFAAGATVGTNVINDDEFDGFSSAGGIGISFSGTMVATTVVANQFASTTTAISGGTGNATSAIAPSCAAGVPTTSYYTINGVPGHC